MSGISIKKFGTSGNGVCEETRAVLKTRDENEVSLYSTNRWSAMASASQDTANNKFLHTGVPCTRIYSEKVTCGWDTVPDALSEPLANGVHLQFDPRSFQS